MLLRELTREENEGLDDERNSQSRTWFVFKKKKKNSSEMQIIQLQRGNKCFHLVLLSVKPPSSPLHRPWCWTCDHSSDICLFSGPTNCFDPVGRCCYIASPLGVPGSPDWEGASAESLSVLLPLRVLEKFKETCRGQPHSCWPLWCPLVVWRSNVLVGPGMFIGSVRRERKRGTRSWALLLEWSGGCPWKRPHPGRNHCGTDTAGRGRPK